MTDQTRARERETEAETELTRLYEPRDYQAAAADLVRAATGRIVVKAKERPWDLHRQAKSKRYLSPFEPELADTARLEWDVFLQTFDERSGKHRHQGGLVIFILEGKGHTIIDGVRHDWEAGDLMLLKMTPGGVEHQHFNDVPGTQARWMALIYWPFFDVGGSEITQLENSPLYDAYMAKLAERDIALAGPKKKARRTK
jgi:hypothetical protein